MNLSDKIWKVFSNFVSWGMGKIPYITVWTAEKAFFIAPSMLRSWVTRYTSERILACVVAGEMPMLPGLDGGDAILFYPLSQCHRYEVLELPELEPVEIFEGHILAFVISAKQRLGQYHLCGYDQEGNCYDAGLLFSRGEYSKTKITRGITLSEGRIQWDVRSKNYLTSFIMIHTNGKPHAAGYSQRSDWEYPDTTYLPHVVIPPDGKSITDANTSAMVLIVDKDAWVPEILMWERE